MLSPLFLLSGYSTKVIRRKVMDQMEKKFSVNLSAGVIRAIHEIVMNVSMPAKATRPILAELETEISRINIELSEEKKEGEE